MEGHGRFERHGQEERNHKVQNSDAPQKTYIYQKGIEWLTIVIHVFKLCLPTLISEKSAIHVVEYSIITWILWERGYTVFLKRTPRVFNLFFCRIFPGCMEIWWNLRIGDFVQWRTWRKETTRWAPASYKWSYNPYKWPYKWLTVLTTLVIGVINPVITVGGPPCIHVENCVYIRHSLGSMAHGTSEDEQGVSNQLRNAYYHSQKVIESLGTWLQPKTSI